MADTSRTSRFNPPKVKLDWAASPPDDLPPGYVVRLHGRGDVVIRDSGGDGPAVLLLHGWMFTADLNFAGTYQPLVEAGYRVIALDHRGHGRGLRPGTPFRLIDCADDAAALLTELGIEHAVALGYSMGGPIAQLLARRHPDLVGGIVLCATAQDWSDPGLKVAWKFMGVLRIIIGLLPRQTWAWLLGSMGIADIRRDHWAVAELARGSGYDIAEAGRELGRFDSRPWIGELRVPAAVVVTTEDLAVPPAKQRAMAEAIPAPVFEVEGDHTVPAIDPPLFTAAVLEALRSVTTHRRGSAAGAASLR
jgi:pimeloyl-ACP methyl ester carboxylesterase